MKQSDTAEFLPGLLEFLATRRFFPDVSSSGNRFAFSVVDSANVEYFCTGQTTSGPGSSTRYEIRRELGPYAGFPHIESLLHFTRIFALINQPFAILLRPDGQLELSCAAIHQTNTSFDFECLAHLFRLNAERIATAMERLSKQEWSHEEIEGMVYVLSGLVKQDIPDAR